MYLWKTDQSHISCCNEMFHRGVLVVHRNIFRYRKSLKTARVKTHDLLMLTASEVIGARVTVFGKYTFVTL